LLAKRVQRRRERAQFRPEPFGFQPERDVEGFTRLTRGGFDARESGVRHLRALHVVLHHVVEHVVRPLREHGVARRHGVVRGRLVSLGRIVGIHALLGGVHAPGAQVKHHVARVGLQGIARGDRGVERGERRVDVAPRAGVVDFSSRGRAGSRVTAALSKVRGE
jgi:hypothetical protein